MPTLTEIVPLASHRFHFETNDAFGRYDSWGMPLSVILVVPMCLLCAVVGMLIARMPVGVFVQVAFRDATVAACRLRLRPIVMTALRSSRAWCRSFYQRSGRRNAVIAGDRRLHWHDRRYGVWNFPYSGFLLCDHPLKEGDDESAGAGDAC
jgi:hypothetical protein